MYQFKLVGFPIQQSLSPWIHSNLLNLSGLEGDYQLYEIHPDEDFVEKVNLLREANVNGFNVTVPYKQRIIPLLDELDEVAKEMGAVNTVVLRDGKWIGYNTDGGGYVRSLEHAFPEFFTDINKKVLLIGAGGAARAIYYALINRGVTQVDIANRTIEKAKEIANLNQTTCKTTVYSIGEIQDILDQYHLIIQTTSVGMESITLEPIVEINKLMPNAIVSDIVYQPLKTKFLEAAEKHGARLLYGHTMLLFQAQYSFEIWTDKLVDVTELEQALNKNLKGR